MKMEKKFFCMLMIAILSLSVSCEDDEEDDDPVAQATQVDLPTVTFTCSSATKCGDDSADGKTAYVTFIDSNSNVAAAGAALVSCTSGTCTATISSFVDSNSNTVTQVDEGKYYVSAAVDVDADNTPGNNGDPVDTTYYIGSGGLTLDSNTGSSLTFNSWTDA